MVCAGLLFLALTCDRSSSTELVMIVEKHRVLLAADSLVTDIARSFAQKRCKIHRSRTLFYAISGVAFDSEVGLDPDTLIAQRRKNITSSAILDEATGSLTAVLQKEIALIKKDDPQHYELFTRGTAPIESIFVVETFGKTVEGYVKDFNVSPEGKVSTTTASNCMAGYSFDAVRRCASITNKDVLKPFLIGFTLTDDVVGNIHRIMGAALSAMPKDVAPPFSILEVEEAGEPRWLEQGLCPDIKAAPKKQVKAAPNQPASEN